MVVGFWVLVFTTLVVIALVIMADHDRLYDQVLPTADLDPTPQDQVRSAERTELETPDTSPRPFAPDGVSFSRIPADPAAAPDVQLIELPDVDKGSAIWGALGRDARGRIWFAVSMQSHGSAHLFNYNPRTNFVDPCGDVVASMPSAVQDDPDVSQIKIHSRIVLGPDDYLYFASMDEQGEDAGKGTSPQWGSHLWRLRLEDNSWHHVAAMPEALIALSCSGRYVYALGYYGHVLYQYDTRSIITARLRSEPVGSVDGHVSRSLISDHRDHVYVPRLRPGDEPDQPPVVTLVEYDSRLNEIAESPLEHYLGRGSPADSHGIVAFQHLRDQSIVFATHEGMLYRIVPPRSVEPAKLEQLGFFHPDGRRYVPSMFTYAGTTYLVAVAKTPKSRFEWLCFDLHTRRATAVELKLQYDDGRIIWKHLLYGSITRDNDGNFYVGGTDQNKGKPVLLKLVPKW